jgi:ubiquinone/menaquinone biosynthesis C-methylase UbiE
MDKTNNKLGHSEQYFTEDRNYWFNPDFLELMAKRWGLHQYGSVLDIGAGLCHWSKILTPFLKPNARITALDNDIKWSKGNPEIEHYFHRHKASIEFVKGNAHELPFKDNSFDVVTCQTVLIHLKNPAQALSEMKRVVKKDGIIICSEPSNRVQAVIQDSTNQHDNIPSILNKVKQNLAFEYYKIQQNQGDSSFGDLLAGTMNSLGIKDIKAYLNDKLVSIYPPYAHLDQQAKLNTYLVWGKTAEEKKEFELRYQSALAKQDYLEFLKNYQPLNSDSELVKSLKNQTYISGGGALLYLISGRK